MRIPCALAQRNAGVQLGWGTEQLTHFSTIAQFAAEIVEAREAGGQVRLASLPAGERPKDAMGFQPRGF